MNRRWVWSIIITLILFTASGSISIRNSYAQADPSGQILTLVNQVRAGYGLPLYVWDNQLAAAAQSQANYMAINNIYSHTGAGGSTPQSRASAAGYNGFANENIVGGTNLTPSQGVTWWRNSSVHFNTMISQRYIHAGVGFAQGHDQNFYALVVGVPSDQAIDALDTQAVIPNDENLAPVAPIQIASPKEDGSIIHVVGPGHSFWAIAARYEIEIEQLYLFNNLTAESVINPGDELIIRLAEGQEPPPTPTPPATHIVGEGESLWTIAAWYKLSLEELLRLNSMEEDSLLQPGDEVRIRLLPGEEPPPTATPQLNHIVQPGDTAWGIALSYGLTLDQFLEFNDLRENSVLSIGDSLLVVSPSATPTITPVPSETPLPTPSPVPSDTPGPSITPNNQSVSQVFESPTQSPQEDDNTINLGRSEPAKMIPMLLGIGLFVFGIGALVIVRLLK